MDSSDYNDMLHMPACFCVQCFNVRNAAGCFLTIQTTVLSDLVGVKNIARAQAFQLLFLGVGALISIPLAGAFFFSNY